MPRAAIDDIFWRAAKKLDKKTIDRARQVFGRFRDDDVPPRPYKKKGPLSETYTLNVGRDFRIFLRQEVDEEGPLYVAFHIGKHDYYERLARSSRRTKKAKR